MTAKEASIKYGFQETELRELKRKGILHVDSKNEYDENNTKEYTIEVTNFGDGLYVLTYDKIIEKKMSNIAINIDMPKNIGETKIIKLNYGK